MLFSTSYWREWNVVKTPSAEVDRALVFGDVSCRTGSLFNNNKKLSKKCNIFPFHFYHYQCLVYLLNKITHTGYNFHWQNCSFKFRTLHSDCYTKEFLSFQSINKARNVNLSETVSFRLMLQKNEHVPALN